MTHYICAGECEGESEELGICHSDECSLKGVVMLECSCDDGKHERVRALYEEAQKQNVEDSGNA